MNGSNVEIKELKEGMKGLFAKRLIEKGKIILVLKGEIFFYPSRTSIQIGNKHIEDEKGSYINHHCVPSAEIKAVPNEKSLSGIVTAVHDIKKGEEITFDYETTEKELLCPFKCDCHGRWITGNKLKYI
tara:strand:- start:216 stop:602 length:387 start_codon:yes stop_codon:yes gene_type:complete